MGFLKGYVRNRSRPEGSIVEGYASEEVIDFYSDYLAGVVNIGIQQSRHEGRLQGVGTARKRFVTPCYVELKKSHFCVLQHMTKVAPYIHEHMVVLREMNLSKSEKWLLMEHTKTFSDWLKERVQQRHEGETIDQLVEQLAYGPEHVVTTYQGYDINRYTFYTKKYDGNGALQNSVVTLIAMMTEFSRATNDARSRIAKESYYSIIKEIWELDYNSFNIPLFMCKWVENKRGVKVDKDDFTILNLSREGYISEPFILAKQASQVFFFEDPNDSRWHIVLHGKRHIVGVENVVDEEEYDHVDDFPPFSVGVLSSDMLIDDTAYLRTDHNEGLWVDGNRNT